jgi:D-glycero-alpha-D-manno-heptose-7-phosphate kinase
VKTSWARAPLRVGLAGGGSDVDPFCGTYGGRVLNATIAKYAYASVKSGTGETLLRSIDQKTESTFSQQRKSLNGNLPLHVNSYKFFCDTYLNGETPPIEIETFTGAPVGSGLGTSSTLVVAMVRALAKHFTLSLDTYEIARSAHTIEREMCQFRGGRQDQYTAAFGGFNFMEFESDGDLINPLRVPRDFVLKLESNMLLHFMGQSRVSSTIIQEQSNAVDSDLGGQFEAMMAIRDEAEAMKRHLLKADLDGVAESIRQGWENKKKTSNKVSTPQIDALLEAALDSGALAGKVSGAGGGGFVLFIVPISKRPAVQETLQKFGGFTDTVEFVENGVEAWDERD